MLAVFAALFVSSSCQKISTNNIYGKWKLVKIVLIDSERGKEYEEYVEYEQFFTFGRGGKFTLESHGEINESSFSINGNTLMLSGSAMSQLTIISLTSSELVMRWYENDIPSDDEDYYDLFFVKQ